MAEFLDSFDVHREALLKALDNLKMVWSKFQDRSLLEVEGSDESESMIMNELQKVEEDLASQQFTIGIFGLIKRGKSTLMNGLIGRQVSSMHVTPETAVPVYVTHGETPSATVHFANGESTDVKVEEVQQYTSQKHNPNNQLGVTVVNQRVPVGFLRNGVRLIDTPGLDDAEADEVYTERTLQELDVVDAGVILFLSPPTVSQTEMSFLEQVVSRDLHKNFLVCNMYPQHFHDPETRNAVLQYVGQRIVEASKRQGRSGEVKVYPVCALEAWEARETDDIDKWKKSGADRLLRDIENYLSDSAGMQVLEGAARRIARAARMAQAEVQVRQQLLDDPSQLDEFRVALDHNITQLENHFEAILTESLAGVKPMQDTIKQVLALPFNRAKKSLAELSSLDEIEGFANKLKRDVEVRGENASKQFEEGFAAITEDLKVKIQERFDTVMADIVPNLPSMELSNESMMLVNADSQQNIQQSEDRSKKLSAATGLATGSAAGVATYVAAGALLGPLGLLGGALVGWKLTSSASKKKTLDSARENLEERMDEILAELYAALDDQMNDAVYTVRAAVEQRRRTFAADLYHQFDVVKTMSEDQERLAKYQQAADQFVQAFEACEKRAYNAVNLPMESAA